MNTFTTHYDAMLRQVKDICFLPYIGKKYPTHDKKLLVVGLSFWGWGGKVDRSKKDPNMPYSDGREWYDAYIREHREKANLSAKEKHFLYRVSALMLGKSFLNYDTIRNEITPDKLEDVWSKIAFMNFIQNTADNRSHAEKKISREVLTEICTIIKPTHILLCSSSQSIWEPWQYKNDANPEMLQTYHPSSSRSRPYYKSKLPSYIQTIQSWNL